MQVMVGECHPKKNLVHAWSPSKRISRACLSAQEWRCSKLFLGAGGPSHRVGVTSVTVGGVWRQCSGTSPAPSFVPLCNFSRRGHRTVVTHSIIGVISLFPFLHSHLLFSPVFHHSPHPHLRLLHHNSDTTNLQLTLCLFATSTCFNLNSSRSLLLLYSFCLRSSSLELGTFVPGNPPR